LVVPTNVLGPALLINAGMLDGLLLTAAQLAESIVWAIRRPSGVDVNTVVVRPLGQPV
jgi:NADP-dependent 3-hydroxy acid dehydrogenase YdfG